MGFSLFLATAPSFVSLPAIFLMALLGCAAFLPPECEILLSQTTCFSSTSSSPSSPSQHDRFQSPWAVPMPFSGLCRTLVGCTLFFFLAVPSSLCFLVARAFFSNMSDFLLLNAPVLVFSAVPLLFFPASGICFWTLCECLVQVAAGTS